jgi:hypothetical protein
MALGSIRWSKIPKRINYVRNYRGSQLSGDHRKSLGEGARQQISCAGQAKLVIHLIVVRPGKTC